ncbi:MAG: hypothetical protein A2X94_12515 [Bdellovibrionales bacterium GWB1_55_8]|nr:MAG: hypothetical protein A2X94_12515 [Bdellovibrionales bacterium GWB1_55_8]
MNLMNALPEQFDFYHLGTVNLEPEHTHPISEKLPDDAMAVAFQLSGDVSAALVLHFEKGLDPSIYSEMGNVIASRVATNLSKMENLDILVSPPRLLSEKHWENLSQGHKLTGRTYLHLHRGISIRLHAILINPPQGNTGHA